MCDRSVVEVIYARRSVSEVIYIHSGQCHRGLSVLPEVGAPSYRTIPVLRLSEERQLQLIAVGDNGEGELRDWWLAIELSFKV